MRKATKQGLFDKAYLGVLKQGGYAGEEDIVDGEFLCSYEDPNGNKCAAGHLIPKGHKALSSGVVWLRLVRTYPKLSFGEKLNRFVGRLQEVHDFCAEKRLSLSDYKEDMAEVAKRHSLTVPEDPK